MKVLVTGGAGFIGSHLVELLVREGYDVVSTVYDRAKVSYLDPSLPVKTFVGDIRDASFVRAAMKGCAAVFHLVAALNEPSSKYADFFSVNVEGTRNVMAAALELGVKKVVHTSSVVTIKENASRVDETHLHSGLFDGGYTLTKFLGEKVALEYGARGLPVTVVNPTIVYGPRDTHTLGNFFRLHLESKLRFVSFSGSVLNLAYVKDVAKGQLLAMKKGGPGQKYILGGEEVTLGQFVTLLDKVAGVHRPVIHTPGFAVSVGTAVLSPLFSAVGRSFPLLKAQVRAMKRGSAVDISKALRELGIPITPVERGIQEALDWYRKTGYIKY